MRIFNIFSVIAVAIFVSVNSVFAQEAQETVSGPSAIESPIGAIIGLILLLLMCFGVAKVALKKE